MHAKYIHLYTTYLYCVITYILFYHINFCLLSYRPIVGLMHSKLQDVKIIYLSHHIDKITTMTSYSTNLNTIITVCSVPVFTNTLLFY